ncbi:hypothetical protein [Nonlabens marinus]|uniref:Uncharacterized protein n=1 Tax=Nonlabens marinus S1-08 TaxID=1454201 RepID=W8VZS2_9FLAO|nr:hypothetical protein [Nonlabens marinus]BAO55071.1 hypothetical protein NMS_1062 [Nonlabens marinus S1-08]
MKKIILTLAIIAIAIPTLSSCREEKTVEVEELAPDAEDSDDDESYDTNPTAGDPD